MRPSGAALGGVCSAARRSEQGRGVGGGGGGGTTEEHRVVSARLSVVRCLPDTMALEAGSSLCCWSGCDIARCGSTGCVTALLVLVMLSAAEDNGWNPLCFPGRGGSLRSPGPSVAATETVS